jgi:N-acyl-D-amino-acid deacylase
MLPPWVQAGGPDATLERLADRSVRERLRSEMAERGVAYAGTDAWNDLRLGYLSTPDYREWDGRTLGELMRFVGGDVVDVVCDLLLAEDLRPNQVTPGPAHGSLTPFITHPLSMIGTDSTFIGSRPSPRTWGSFPRVLGEFVREARALTLEEAARLGLTDRGLLRDGLAADIVVFDPSTVRSTATYEAPRSFPEGIPFVVVNGVVVVDHGEHTGALPGRALRRH